MIAPLMSPRLALPAYLVAIVLVAGGLSPPLFSALHRAGFTGSTLEDVCLRVFEVAAIVLTVPLLAALGGGSRTAWGLPTPERFWRRASRGALIGIASLAPVCVLLFVLGVRVTKVDLEADVMHWLLVLAGITVSTAMIAVSEEFLFRGGLFTAVSRVGGSTHALWVVALVYAASHFLDAPDAAAELASHRPLGGFQILAQAFAQVPLLENLDSFVALLCAGVVLGIARLRDGDVALCVGIHAGWVFTIKVFKKLTYVSDQTPMRVLAGTYDDVIGWLAAIVLGALAIALWRWPRAPQNSR